MSSQLQRLAKLYNVHPYLNQEDMKMLQQGGIPFSDSENQNQSHIFKDKMKNLSDIQLTHLKSKYSSNLNTMERQISFLKNQLDRQKKANQLQKHKIVTQARLQQDRLMAELRNVRARVIHSQGQIPLIKQALSQVRDMLSGIIPENVYLRLRDLPERDLPPQQWLLVNVWQLTYPFKKQGDLQKKEILKLREQLKMTNDKQHSLLGELQHYARLLSSKDQDQKRHLLNFENNRKSLQLEIQKLRDQLELYREKGFRYDQLLRDYNFTKQQKELLQEKIGYYNKERATETVIPRSSDDLFRKIDLLQHDKEYLTKENIHLLQKNKRLEDRIDKLQEELIHTKNKSQEYLQQLLSNNKDNSLDYEKRIFNEISELKQKHEFELSAAKNNLIDIYQKQLRFLKEAKEETEIRLDYVQRELKEKQKAYQDLLLQNRNLQRKYDSENAEIRVSLRLKQEEYDRYLNLYQDANATLKSIKLQNDMLRDKLNTIKAEYYKVEANAKEQTASIRAQLAVAKEQLYNYQVIQKEIDKAVEGLDGKRTEEKNVYLQTLSSLPTSNKRRMQQAMNLSTRLIAKQKDLQNLRLQQNQKNHKISNLQEQLRIAKSLLNKTNQPYSYLVSNIQEKEKEVVQYKMAYRKKEQEVQVIREEYNQCKIRLEEAESHVRQLLIKREQIQNLQNLLINLTKSGRQNVHLNVQDIIEEIQQLLAKDYLKKPQRIIKQQEIKQRQQGQPYWYQKLKSNLKKK